MFRHVLLGAQLPPKPLGPRAVAVPVTRPSAERPLGSEPLLGPGTPGGKARVSGERTEDMAREGSERFDPLDPATRQAAQLAPPSGVAAAPLDAVRPADAEIAPRARVSMEELLPQLVKRIAWAGDRRRGSVQLELGAGRHAGTVVTVHAEDGRVRVELDGGSADELRSKIRARLERQGLAVESVT